jgi:hypothetical protein
MIELGAEDEARVGWVRDLDHFVRQNFQIDILDFDLLEGLVTSPTPAGDETAEKLLIRGRELIASAGDEPLIAKKLDGHLAVLEALLGQVSALEPHLQRTQAIDLRRISSSSIEKLRHRAEVAAETCGVSLNHLAIADNPFDEPMVTDRAEIQTQFAQRFEVFRAQIEQLIGRPLEFEIEISFVDIDQYWRFWVDGVGTRFRLRFNRFKDGFTPSQIDQFVLHELVAHCGQATGWRHQIASGTLNPIHGLTAIHTWEQSHLEGLAQAIPLFLHDNISDELRARVLKDALRQALLNNAYIAAEDGQSPEAVFAACHEVLPIKKPLRFFKSLGDQKRHAQLRSYMFAYPDGVLALIDRLDNDTSEPNEFLKRSFERPFLPSELRS